jgi:hypothetical protein
VGGDDGGGAWLIRCHISHYLQSWDNGETLTPLYLVAASEYIATRELVESSCMATMGVLHGYYVAEYRIICRAGTMGRHSAHSASWLPGSTELPESWHRARGWRRGATFYRFLQSYRSRQSPVPRSPHCWAAARDRDEECSLRAARQRSEHCPPEAESEDSRAVDPGAGSTGPGPAGNHVSAGTLKGYQRGVGTASPR